MYQRWLPLAGQVFKTCVVDWKGRKAVATEPWAIHDANPSDGGMQLREGGSWKNYRPDIDRRARESTT